MGDDEGRDMDTQREYYMMKKRIVVISKKKLMNLLKMITLMITLKMMNIALLKSARGAYLMKSSLQ